MHEVAIARAIVDAVRTELERVRPHPARLKQVRVAAGAGHPIAPGALKTAYAVLSRGTPADGSTLVIRKLRVRARCGRCGWHGALRGPLFVCGACQAGGLQLTGGRELYLERLVLEDAHAPHA